MHSLRHYFVTALALLFVVVLLGLGYSCGLIGARTIKAEPASIGVAKATPFPGAQPLIPGSDKPVSGATQQADTSDIGNNIQPTIVGAGPNEPAFTEADVRRFIARYSNGFGRIGLESGTLQITSIEFLTVAALQQKMTDPLNLQAADTNLVCYVEYSGTFFVQRDTGEKFYYSHVGQVFDAHTGNPLMITSFNR